MFSHPWSKTVDTKVHTKVHTKYQAFTKECGFKSKKFSFKHFEDEDRNEEKFHFSIEIKVWLLFVFSIIPSVALMFLILPVLSTISSVCIQIHLLCIILCHFSLSVFHDLECSLAILFFLYSADTCSKRLAQI